MNLRKMEVEGVSNEYDDYDDDDTFTAIRLRK